MKIDNSWCSAPIKNSNELLAEVDSKVNKLLSITGSTNLDVQNIRNRKLDLIPKNFQVDYHKLESLRRLCQLWEVDIRVSEITSHRKMIGPLIVRAKKILFPVVKFFLKDLIREQRDFNASVIQLCAQICNDHK